MSKTNDASRKYLDPEVVSKLRNMELRARLVVEGFVTGLHKSPYHGFSVEFAEHRQYMPGDPLKHIDWKVFGKTDRFYIKEYEEETNLKAYILLDSSASMGYHAPKTVSKLEYGSYLAASLAYLLIKQQDAVGLLTFDNHVRQYIPPRSIRSHLHVLLVALEQLQPSETTNASVAFHELAERIKRRGLIIVISDFFDDPEQVLLGLKHFRHKHHEVIVFHILDHDEVEFPFQQEAIFRDMETGEEILTQPWTIRKEYREQINAMKSMYQRECREQAIDYIPLTTRTPFDFALTAYLNKRIRLG
ncbi:MAG: DUF58 domain-containing protein [Gemmatimonadetes bacterium]|nr:MAG: DUF58 domain-containing protein [Gemmatimonadota bacterium]